MWLVGARVQVYVVQIKFFSAVQRQGQQGTAQPTPCKVMEWGVSWEVCCVWGSGVCGGVWGSGEVWAVCGRGSGVGTVEGVECGV